MRRPDYVRVIAADGRDQRLSTDEWQFILMLTQFSNRRTWSPEEARVMAETVEEALPSGPVHDETGRRQLEEFAAMCRKGALVVEAAPSGSSAARYCDAA